MKGAPKHLTSHHTPAAPSAPVRPRTAARGSATLVFRVTSSGAGWAPGKRARAIAHAAGDPADTISDYKFSPASITIHVGDTITWTNNGPTAHTATASDGSFNTGTLKKGQSASHTFTKVGTIAYICAIHPFMHGTVVVVANATPSGGGSGSGSSGSGTTSGSGSGTSTPSASSAGSTAPAASGPSLPNTGLNVVPLLGAGLLLVGLGMGMSRRARARG